jgi:DNA-binding response OmpR family regulator
MQAYDLKDVNVLVLEKHGHIRSLLKDVLFQLTARNIEDASNTDDGLAMFHDSPPDLILTDWSPGLDGIQFLKQVRNHGEKQENYVPVIMLTANTGIDHVRTARDAGMSEYLAKPFTVKLIYSRICSVIESQRPFVRADLYFGPDRRRRRIDFAGRERRHHANMNHADRRRRALPIRGPERRQGKPGYQAPERRQAVRR